MATFTALPSSSAWSLRQERWIAACASICNYILWLWARLHHRTFKAREVAVGRSLVHILDGFFAAVLYLAVYRPDRGLDCRYLGSSCPYVQAPRLWQLRYSLYTVSAGHVLAHTSSYATRHTLVKYTFYPVLAVTLLVIHCLRQLRFSLYTVLAGHALDTVRI